MNREEVTGRRTEPARAVDPGVEVEETTRECPHCHATSVGDVAFCGACGYDFVTGVPPQSQDDQPWAGRRRPTAEQSAEPLDAHTDPRRDANDIALRTTPPEVALDPHDLARRPEVPPPTPPGAHQSETAHEVPQHRPPSREADAEWVAEVWVDHAWYATRETDQPVPEAGPPVAVNLTQHSVVIGRTNVERGLRPDLDAGTDAGVSVRHAQLTSDGHRWWVEDLDTSNGTYVSTVGHALPTDPIERGVRVQIDEDDRVFLGAWTRLMLRRRA